MVPNSGTPVRAHRLRPLNSPRRVFVELSERGFPRAVLEQRQATGGIAAPTLLAVEARSNLDGTDPETDEWIRREVESVGEIWKVDDEWWRQPISRRYIEVVMKGGKHSVLYLDMITNEWFEQTP